jgi:hypothetical protein
MTSTDTTTGAEPSAQADETPAASEGVAAPVTTAPATPDPDKGIEALARQEAAIRERESKIKASERELRQFQAIREAVGKDPTAALELMGTSYEALTDHIVKAGGTPDPTEALQARIAQLEAGDKANRIERGKAYVRAQADDSGIPEAENIKALGAHDEVFAHLAAQRYESGDTPDIKAAVIAVDKTKRAQFAALQKIYGVKAPASNTTAARASGPGTLTQGGPGTGGSPADDLPLDDEARLSALFARHGVTS